MLEPSAISMTQRSLGMAVTLENFVSVMIG